MYWSCPLIELVYSRAVVECTNKLSSLVGTALLSLDEYKELLPSDVAMFMFGKNTWDTREKVGVVLRAV